MTSEEPDLTTKHIYERNGYEYSITKERRKKKWIKPTYRKNRNWKPKTSKPAKVVE